MTATELHRAATMAETATRRAEELRARRDQLVRQALATGWTHQRIADATGLTRGRINQIRAAS